MEGIEMIWVFLNINGMAILIMWLRFWSRISNFYLVSWIFSFFWSISL